MGLLPSELFNMENSLAGFEVWLTLVVMSPATALATNAKQASKMLIFFIIILMGILVNIL
jgi:hypothetical protein